MAIQLPVCVDQDGARGAEGGEHRADAAVDELAGRRHHRLRITLGDSVSSASGE